MKHTHVKYTAVAGSPGPHTPPTSVGLGTTPPGLAAGQPRAGHRLVAALPPGYRGAGASLARRLADDGGAATAEYVITTMAAVGFAALLVVILRGDTVRAILVDMVTRSLTFSG